MRVLNITAQKPMDTGSGVYLTELSAAMAALGHPQGVLAGIYEGETPALPNDTAFFPVYFKSAALPFPIPGMSDEMPYESLRYSQLTEEMLRRYRAAFLGGIRAAVAVFKPDVILCHHLYLLTAMVREEYPGMPVAGLCHGSDLRQLRNNPLAREYITGQIAKLNHIFCLHEEQRREICRIFAIDASRVHVAGSGYNSRVFRALPGEERDCRRIAFAGKISEKKGVLSLIRAMSLLPLPTDTLRLSLAGGYDNPDYPAVRELIRACPCEVELLGRLPQGELAALFNRCGLFVLPSFYEGLPLVLLEAMACGARAVCTDLPGIRPWLAGRLPGHGVRFVEPPAMVGVDTPEPSALPAFEQALAAAIAEALTAPPFAPPPALRDCSWQGVAGKLLAQLG